MTSIRTRRLATAELMYRQEIERIDRESRDDYGNEHHLAMIRALNAADRVDEGEGVIRVPLQGIGGMVTRADLIKWFRSNCLLCDEGEICNEEAYADQIMSIMKEASRVHLA